MARLPWYSTLIGFSLLVIFIAALTVIFFPLAAPPSSPTVAFIDLPEQPAIGHPFPVSWRVDSSPTSTPFTAIYFDTIATPSALTASDYPDRVGYRYHTTDFTSGTFDLPDTFTAILTPPPRADTLYLRGYAKINGQHFWTDEITLTLH